MSQSPSSAGGLIGQRLGNYELLALLALGGTAEIYLARIATVAGFEKYVVVKCLHDHLADDVEFVRMFLDEARLGAQLDHSNIVHTLELGEHRARYYMVMEYLAGLSLSVVARKVVERVPGGRLPLDLTLGLLAQACGGLHYAHQRTGSSGQPLNVVHRDVSPQNLVVSFEGVLKIVDFGIAKAADRVTRTQSGTIKGKFAYMAPEQCLGGHVDCRTDIFALGVILHELLTGRRLFKRQSAYDTYQAILECKVAPPSYLNPELDPSLDELVLKALAYQPDRRYASAEAFGDAIINMLHRRGKSVAPGMVAQFFEHYFGREIAEHGQRMRELADGRLSATMDEQWDDGGDSGLAALSAAKSPRASHGAGDAGDNGGGVTRIELNPLEAARQRHEHITGQQVALPERADEAEASGSPRGASAGRAGAASSGAATMRKQPPASPPLQGKPAGGAGEGKSMSAVARDGKPAGSRLAGQQTKGGSRGTSRLPSPVDAVQRRRGRAMVTADGIPSPLQTSHRSGPMASARTLHAVPGVKLTTPPTGTQSSERSGAAQAPAGTSGPVAAPPARPEPPAPPAAPPPIPQRGAVVGSGGRQDGRGSGGYPLPPELLRTQIADPSSAKPAGEPAPPAPERPPAGQPNAAALMRTMMIADSGATPAPQQQPKPLQPHDPGNDMAAGAGGSAGMPDDSSGSSALFPGDRRDPQRSITPMPSVARPMGSADHAVLVDEEDDQQRPMSTWLLGLIFVVVVGASLGVTVLLAKIL